MGAQESHRDPKSQQIRQELHKAQTPTDQDEQNIYVYVNTTCLPVIIRRTL